MAEKFNRFLILKAIKFIFITYGTKWMYGLVLIVRTIGLYNKRAGVALINMCIPKGHELILGCIKVR